MDCPGKVFGRFESALDERFIDDHFRGDGRQFTFCQASTCFRIGSKLRCIRSTPTEMQSMGENDFECFASTGVNTPGTIFPDSGPMPLRQWPSFPGPGNGPAC